MRAPLNRERAAAGARVAARLERAAGLLDVAAAADPPRLDSDAALNREARRLRPWLETLVGRPYGRLPALSFRRGLEARLAGPWSQYLTLGVGITRLVRLAPPAGPEAAAGLPTLLAHELAHRYAFDESVTTLRGLEVSARLAEEGCPQHAVSARLELARLLVGAACAEALAWGDTDAVQRFLDSPGRAAPLARARAALARRRARGGADWALRVYAALPVAALEAALHAGEREARPLAFPRFPLDSAQAALAWAYTSADRLTGRRRTRVPVDASLRLLRGAGA